MYAVCFLLLSALGPVPVQAVSSLVDLTYTRLQGISQANGVTQWLGVRYAAPPVGNLRFAAPIPPPSTTGDVDATKFGPICMPQSASDATMQPNARFTVAEDCLYMNIFAPSNATRESKLPIMYFVQGGGFSSNSNANFDGSALAESGNIVVAQVNYRVGPYGFLQSKEVQANASLNNGLKDQIQGMMWLRDHAAAFGGDPLHIVAAGNAAGATSLALLLPSFAQNNPGVMRGVILESPSVATIRDLAQGQEQYNRLLKKSGCANSSNTLECLRSKPALALQTEDCKFAPHLDSDLIKEPMLTAFDNGRFQNIPVLAGTCNDEGTKIVPRNLTTTAQALQWINDQAFDVLSDKSLGLINATYMNVQIPGLDQSRAIWRKLANADSDFGANCITARMQNAMARNGVRTYNYRFAVKDPEQEALGFGAYQSVELHAVFGPNNTDGTAPKSYFTTNAAMVPTTMAYWTSFVKTLDPNAMRLPGVPTWMPWTGTEGRERMRFQTGNMAMETMNETQRNDCEMLDLMLPAIERPLPKGTIINLQQPGLSLGTSWAIPYRNGSGTGTGMPGTGGGGNNGSSSPPLPPPTIANPPSTPSTGGKPTGTGTVTIIDPSPFLISNGAPPIAGVNVMLVFAWVALLVMMYLTDSLF